MLYIKIDSASDLRSQFINMNRDHYSYEAYEAMIEYFDDYLEPEELDVIAICCDFSEESEEEFRRNYDVEDDESVERYLEDNAGYYRLLDNGNIFYINF